MRQPTKELLQALVAMQRDANAAVVIDWFRESQKELLGMLVDCPTDRETAVLQGEVRAVHEILNVHDTAAKRLVDFDVTGLDGIPPTATGG